MTLPAPRPALALLVVALAALSLSGTADAARKARKPPTPPPEDVEEEDPEIDDESGLAPLPPEPFETFEPDEDEARPGASAAADATGVPGIGLEVMGRRPLAANWEPRIVAVERGAVVVEMPVLVCLSREDLGGGTFWLVSEAVVDGTEVAETRQRVAPEGVAESGPSFVFVKVQVPVAAPSGAIEIRVSRAPGTGDAAAERLFSRSLTYALP